MKTIGTWSSNELQGPDLKLRYQDSILNQNN